MVGLLGGLTWVTLDVPEAVLLVAVVSYSVYVPLVLPRLPRPDALRVRMWLLSPTVSWAKELLLC